jgi:hypothetical protein
MIYASMCATSALFYKVRVNVIILSLDPAGLILIYQSCAIMLILSINASIVKVGNVSDFFESMN